VSEGERKRGRQGVRERGREGVRECGVASQMRRISTPSVFEANDIAGFYGCLHGAFLKGKAGSSDTSLSRKLQILVQTNPQPSTQNHTLMSKKLQILALNNAHPELNVCSFPGSDGSTSSGSSIG